MDTPESSHSLPSSSTPPPAGGPQRPALHVEAGILGTPADIPESYDRRAPFWRPTWSEMARYLSWRWVFVAPSAMVLLGVPVVFILWPNAAMAFLFGWFKPVTFAVAVIVSVIIYQIRHVTRLRKEPFCIHCGYSLVGLADGSACPECGRRFSLRAVDEYRKDPRWFVERYHAAGRLPSSAATLDVPSVPREPGGSGATDSSVGARPVRPAELAGMRPRGTVPPR